MTIYTFIFACLPIDFAFYMKVALYQREHKIFVLNLHPETIRGKHRKQCARYRHWNKLRKVTQSTGIPSKNSQIGLHLGKKPLQQKEWSTKEEATNRKGENHCTLHN